MSPPLPTTLAFCGAALTSAPERAACCAKIRCAANIGSPTLVVAVPRRALTFNRALPGSTGIACADTRLAGAVCLRASRPCPALLCVASALASASSRIQCAAILALANALAPGILPGLDGGIQADAAVAVLHGFFQRHRRIVELFEVHISEEVRDFHEGELVGSAPRLDITALHPSIQRVLRDILSANLALELRIAPQSHTSGPVRLGRLAALVASGGVAAQLHASVANSIASRGPPKLRAQARGHASVADFRARVHGSQGLHEGTMARRHGHVRAESPNETDLPFFHLIGIVWAAGGQCGEPVEHGRLQMRSVVCTEFISNEPVALALRRLDSIGEALRCTARATNFGPNAGIDARGEATEATRDAQPKGAAEMV